MGTGSRTAVGGRRVAQRILGFYAATALLAVGCATPGTSVTRTPDTSVTRPTASTAPSTAVVPSAEPAVTPGPSASGKITLYTSVTQGTVDKVVDGYTTTHPGVTVEVFRAPTGELAARIAAELRAGRIGGDVLWLTDPLSIQAYDAQGLLRAWTPTEASEIDAAYRGDTYWGTRFLNMVLIHGAAVTPAPAAWDDLIKADYKDGIGIPDPGFAGSAFGALAYFVQRDAGKPAFYEALKSNGATQVKTPDEVTTGVAEGRFKVGITLDNSARTAITKGSPIAMIWPSDGAIAMYSPIGVVKATENAIAAESFVDFVLSDPGQSAIAATGWQPIRTGLGGPPPEGKQVFPDWPAAFGQQEKLLTDYRAIFGG